MFLLLWGGWVDKPGSVAGNRPIPGKIYPIPKNVPARDFNDIRVDDEDLLLAAWYYFNSPPGVTK